jgi:hypothetical protein
LTADNFVAVTNAIAVSVLIRYAAIAVAYLTVTAGLDA